jgi:hypothetical protein
MNAACDVSACLIGVPLTVWHGGVTETPWQMTAVGD